MEVVVVVKPVVGPGRSPPNIVSIYIHVPVRITSQPHSQTVSAIVVITKSLWVHCSKPFCFFAVGIRTGKSTKVVTRIRLVNQGINAGNRIIFQNSFVLLLYFSKISIIGRSKTFIWIGYCTNIFRILRWCQWITCFGLIRFAFCFFHNKRSIVWVKVDIVIVNRRSHV